MIELRWFTEDRVNRHGDIIQQRVLQCRQMIDTNVYAGLQRPAVLPNLMWSNWADVPEVNYHD